MLHGVEPRLLPITPVSTPPGPVTPIPHAAPSNAGSPFDRIDSAEAPQVLQSTPQRLSVGLHDPSLGWVEIRTHAEAGAVAATLSAGSVEAHAALTAQLPDLRQDLAAQQVRVDTLVADPLAHFSQQGGNSSGHRNSSHAAGEPAPQKPPASSSSFPGEPEALSYINVRV